VTSTVGKERRRAHRYLLTLPCRVVRASKEEVEYTGRTHNLSSRGAFFVVDGPVEPGAPIEFFVTLQEDPTEKQEVYLHCRGHVVRLDKTVSNDQLGVGVTIDRYQFERRDLN